MSVEIVSTQIDDSKTEDPAEGTKGPKIPLYAGLVSYKYKYKGTEYASSRRNFDIFYTESRSQAEKDIATYQVGKTVGAWIDPRKPENAVLERTINLTPYLMMGFISIFALFGGAIMVVGLVGVAPNARATPAQEVIFDMPVVAWAVVMGMQVLQYFSNSSAPYPTSIYYFVAALLAFFAILVYVRAIPRGLVPSPGRGQSATDDGEIINTFGSRRRAEKHEERR